MREHPNQRVLFIATRAAMERAQIHGSRHEILNDPSANERLRSIGIKYVESDEDVRAWACFRHAAPAETQPSCVIVDDLGSMVRGSDPAAALAFVVVRRIKSRHMEEYEPLLETTI